MAANYLLNIQGCIDSYADISTAKVWLAKAARENSSDDFLQLVAKLYEWIVENYLNHELSDALLSMLDEFDNTGEKARTEHIEWCRESQDKARRVRQENEKKRLAALREKEARRAKEKHERLRLLEEREKAEELKRKSIKSLRAHLDRDFFSADDYYRTIPSGIVSPRELTLLKIEFVRDWHSSRIRAVDPHAVAPDIQQLAAIAAVNGNYQVVARAGSGKTATLVLRALFLIDHCKVPPRQLLILAFNKKASIEVKRRLLTLLDARAESAIRSFVAEAKHQAASRRASRGNLELEAVAVDKAANHLGIELPHIMTFHALAYSLVHPEESLLFDGEDGDSQGLSRVFQQVIDDHIRSEAHRSDIRKVMLTHFREDWERIANGRYDQSMKELLTYRRNLPRQSLAGDYVKSYGEKVIADFLFEHDIAYKYERNHWWGGINYRPDFTVFTSANAGVVIEYFGLEGDDDYDEQSDAKRGYWANKPDWTLIELTPRDMALSGAAGLLEKLRLALQHAGVAVSRLTEEEIWHRIKDRAIDRFPGAMVSFVSRCRKRMLKPVALDALIAAYQPITPAESMFLPVAKRLYSAYLQRLEATGEEDFDGLMQRAIQRIQAGNTQFQRKEGAGDVAHLRYISVDEFQDFSPLFCGLLTAIQTANQQAQFFCVGDDWQAINGFAGSDLKYFENFSDYFSHPQKLYISTNYRSSRAVVQAGNALMKGLGEPALVSKASQGDVIIADVADFEPSVMEKERHRGDVITPMVSRIANKSLEAGSDVVMLARRNGLPWYIGALDAPSGGGTGLSSYLEHVRSLFPEALRSHISVSTTHKYKGMEKPTVIILDAVDRSYPLIHPDWVFCRVLGDTLSRMVAEERRLFYVALTRAIGTLVIVTDRQRPSSFLQELRSNYPMPAMDWREHPPVNNVANSRIVVKVGNQSRTGGAGTYAIRDLLKAAGYQWQSAGWPCWAKSFLVNRFAEEVIQQEVWAKHGTGLEVRICNESEEVVARFLVDGGQFRRAE